MIRWGLNYQRTEIQCHLNNHGIHLSEGEISYLSDEFLVRYHIWFDASRPHWAPRLRRGLILQIDGTQKNGGPVTYRAISHRQGVTVHATSMKSENKDDIVEFLETVKQEVGTPRLILRDGSPAEKNACDCVFPSVLQGLCHWHWLGNVGEKLLNNMHEGLRKAVLATKQLARLEELRRKLVEVSEEKEDLRRRVLRVWTRLLLEHVLGKRDSTGGAPFRLSYRDVMGAVRKADERIKPVVKQAQAWNLHEPFLLEVKERLDALDKDPKVRAMFLTLDRRWSWFSKLRSWLRLEDAESGRPAETSEQAGKPLEEAEVARRIHGLRDEAREAGREEEAAWRRVCDSFEEHRRELFPRVRLRNLPRTTAQIELAHREDQRSSRRRMGVLNVGGSMERVGEHLAVWSNVRKPWFVRHALKGVDLGVEFWRQDLDEVKAGVEVLRAKRWRDRLPVAAKAREGLLDEFVGLVGAGASVGVFVAWADRVEGVV